MEKHYHITQSIENQTPLEVTYEDLVSFANAARFLRISEAAVTQAARKGSVLGIELVTVYQTGQPHFRYLLWSAVEAWKAARQEARKP